MKNPDNYTCERKYALDGKMWWTVYGIWDAETEYEHKTFMSKHKTKKEAMASIEYRRAER